MIGGTGLYCLKCERPDAELVVTQSTEGTATVLVCLHPRCGHIETLSSTLHPDSPKRVPPPN